MPINLGSIGGPSPDEQPPSQAAADALAGVTNENESGEEQGKPKRRNKAQMIADAVVPGMDDVVTIKDLSSGVKVERMWRVAVEMVRDGKADWPDNVLKYAFLKYEQQRAQGAFATTDEPSVPIEQAVERGQHQESGKDGNIPPEAEVGDEIIIGSKTYRLGHGRVLTHGVIGNPDGSIIQAKRRWQRELGTGVNGPWESTPLSLSDRIEDVMAQDLAGVVANATDNNGNGVTVQTERQPLDVERVDLMTWKIGTGILNKIGLPDYSQLQIGPINASRMVIDDGRRTKVKLGEREAQIPTAVIEAFQEVSDTVEHVARYQRGELVSFLESVGALRQPVSS